MDRGRVVRGGGGGGGGGGGAFSVCQHQCARSASLCGWEGDGVVCVCVCGGGGGWWLVCGHVCA